MDRALEYLNFLNTLPKSKEKRFAIMITKLCYHWMKYYLVEGQYFCHTGLVHSTMYRFVHKEEVLSLRKKNMS